ncbi:hypothetical protein LXA43DRAFT_1061936 [Ganoderma leucocontextum]|nr:hypothetical protein LXA43DRAFT_1061936 [Ganoderma leucocontextum]
MSLSKYFLSCNNQQCKFGCGFYLPVGVPDSEYVGGPDIPAKTAYFAVKCKAEPSAPSDYPQNTTKSSVPPPFAHSSTSGATEDTLFGSRSMPRSFNASTPDSGVPPQHPSVPAPGVTESTPSSDVPPRPTVNNSTQHGHGPFRAHGLKREERMADVGDHSSGRADQPEGSGGRRAFNPADKAYSASTQFDKDDRSKRKRRQSPTTSRKKPQTSKTDTPNVTSKGKKATKTKGQVVELQFVLLPQTSAIYREKYKRPNLADIVRLRDQGFVSKKVSLPMDASNEAIRDAVSSLDSGCFQDPTVASFLSTYGWHTLQAFPPPVKLGKKTTQGEMYYVKTMRDGHDKDVDVQTLKQATAFTGLRGGPRAGYDNLVLIALPQGSPDVPYDLKSNESSEGEDGNMDEGKGESDEEMDEGDHADNGTSDAPPRSHTERSFDEPGPEDDTFGREYFEAYTTNEDYVDPGRSNAEDLHQAPSEDTLLLNMHAPDLGSRSAKAIYWWASEEHSMKSLPLREFLNERPWVETLLDKVLGNSKSASSPQIHLPILLFEIENGVVEPLTFLISLVDQLRASKDGPPASIDSFADAFREQFTLGPAVTLLMHLRNLVPRSNWVPKPHFREFFQAYDAVKDDLSHATSVEWDTSGLIEVDIATVSAGELQEKLSGAFGHHSNHLVMNGYSIKVGEFGLDSFIRCFVVPVLDNPPLSDDERYKSVLGALQTFLGALTRKLRNFAKTRGKSSKPANEKDANYGAEKPKQKSTNKEDEPRPPPFECPPSPSFCNLYAESPSTDGGQGSWRDLGEDRFEPGAKAKEDAKSGKSKPPRTDPPPGPNEQQKPRSQPKPRPKVKTPTTALGKLELLEARASSLSWSALVDEVLKKFPHPLKPIQSHAFNRAASIKLYHPDKNLGGNFTQEWHTIAGRICALLNGKKEDILGTPWVPEPAPEPKPGPEPKE